MASGFLEVVEWVGGWFGQLESRDLYKDM